VQDTGGGAPLQRLNDEQREEDRREMFRSGAGDCGSGVHVREQSSGLPLADAQCHVGRGLAWLQPSCGERVDDLGGSEAGDEL